MKKNTRNAEYTKEYNRKSLLRYLRNENLSRAELSRRMGLSRAAISIIAEELLNEGMVAETAAVESRVGRTPVPLMLLPEAGYAIGVFLNRTDTLAGLVDICGTVLEQTKIPPEMLEGKDRMEILSGIIMDLIRRSGVDRERIVGIGISAPGPLDGEKGIILNPPHFEQWYRSPIGPELQKRTGYPVYLENDASCLARYNLGKPEARGSEDYLLLMVEKGVGSGVISRGHVLKGAGYFTSELGHTSIDYQGRLCSCGNRGCLEMYASLENLLAGSPFRDWRELIDNKDIDVVIIGTPDHWHCLQLVAACQAGKDVYCEKPLGNSIEECNIMVRAAEKYQRVVQVGQWQRSDPHWQDAMDFVHSGKLGKIRTVRVFSYQGWCPSIPVQPDQPVPEGVDYDMWLGPAPKRPFNPNRFHFTFRWFWDYAGGLMTDWGVHLLDYALYGMNVTAPNSIMASGGKFGYPDDACETPDLLQTIYTFNDFTVMWDHAIGIDDGAYGRNHGLGFVGENGTLVIDRNGWEVIPEKVSGVERMEPVALQKSYGEGGLNLHAKNHLACIKDRNLNCNASIQIGAHIAKFAHLGNIAYRTGKKLSWDGKTFHDAEADTYLCKTYREPWKLPVV